MQIKLGGTAQQPALASLSCNLANFQAVIVDYTVDQANAHRTKEADKQPALPLLWTCSLTQSQAVTVRGLQ